jgi:phosphoribosylaminoimidazolecarboxamide formyltransferase / IMP cyclohydrolase
MPTALVTAYNYRGLLDFTRRLDRAGWDMIATPGTHVKLKKHNIPSTPSRVITGLPDNFCRGRVKTLHPAIFGAILAPPGDMEMSSMMGRIDLLIINFYPFAAVASKGYPPDACREFIDVGGPALVFAALKSNRVGVVTDPADYSRVAASLRKHVTLPESLRRELLVKALLWTGAYQVSIINWLLAREDISSPEVLLYAGVKKYPLRYGENPHQTGDFYQTLSEPPSPKRP